MTLLCSLCEGPRDVVTRTLLGGVPVAVCDWCWQSYGPARHGAQRTPAEWAVAAAAVLGDLGGDE